MPNCLIGVFTKRVPTVFIMVKYDSAVKQIEDFPNLYVSKKAT